jgi:hypothetical protein
LSRVGAGTPPSETSRWTTYPPDAPDDPAVRANAAATATTGAVSLDMPAMIVLRLGR